MKILIVEDEPSLRELMQRTLEKERYVVEVAATYGQALQKIEDYNYDCILLDIMLPDGSGLDLLDRFKALRKQGNVIIIPAYVIKINPYKNTIRLGNVVVSPDKFQVSVNGADVPLLRKEYDILYYFILRPGHLVDKSVLAEAVWGDHIDQADNFDFIYAQMKNLRKKLRDAGAEIEIKSVYGFGYKLVVAG